MNMHIKSFALMLLASASLALPAFGAPAPKPIYESEIRLEQDIATARIKDARNDLHQSEVSFSHQMYFRSWFYITECRAKIKMTEERLKGHPERIIRAISNFLGIRLGQKDRDKWTASYMKIKDDINLTYRELRAVETDVGQKLGIDITAYSQYLAMLKALCDDENVPNRQAYCAAYDKAMAAMESGNINGLREAIAAVQDQATQQAINSGKDVAQPPPDTRGGAAASGSAAGTTTGGTSAAGAATGGTTAVGTTTGGTTTGGTTPGGASSGPSAAQVQQAQQILADKIAANVPGAAVLAERVRDLQKRCNGGDSAACRELVDLIGSIIRGEEPKPFQAAGSNTAIRIKTSDGQEVTIRLDGEGVVIKQRWNGRKGGSIASETKQRLLLNPNATEPYGTGDIDWQDVESRAWSFGISNETLEQSGSVSVQQLTLADAGGRTEFSVTAWKVTDSAGNVVAEGSGNSIEARFTQTDNYTIEVRGITEWKTEFCIVSELAITL